MTQTTEQAGDYYAEVAAPAVSDSDRRRLRVRVLTVAAAFTSTPGSAEAVTANAGPLLAWIEEATDAADMRARWRAMDEHHSNTLGFRPANDPERFLAEARHLYEFITTGQTAAA